MSRPSKRFVLPYEPEFTAHRTDRRMERSMRLHKLAREHVISPGLVPHAAVAEPAAVSGSTRRQPDLELQPVGFPHKN